jgi:hypothetical protein
MDEIANGNDGDGLARLFGRLGRESEVDGG